MKALILSFILLFPSFLMAADLTIKINGTRNDDGTMRVYLYAEKYKKDFLRDGFKDFSCKKYSKIKDNQAEVTCENVAPGNYALTFFHDENDNINFDTNWAGLPSEGYGFSLNYVPKLKKPTFEQVQFTVEKENQTHELKTIY